MVGNSRNSYDVLFRPCLGNSLCSAVNSFPKAKIYFSVSRMAQSVTSTTPLGGFEGAGAPPRCRPPFYLVVKKKGEAQPKSCFDLAENRAASSPWVGDHR